jgi:hypothetical protein
MPQQKLATAGLMQRQGLAFSRNDQPSTRIE